MAFALVGNVEDVRNGRCSSTAKAAGRPRFRLPCRDGAVLLCRYLHFGEARRTVAANHQFDRAVEKQLHGPPAAGLRKTRGFQAPKVGCKLAAESTADI